MPAHSKQSSKTTASDVNNAWGWGMEAEIPGPASFTMKLPWASALPNRIWKHERLQQTWHSWNTELYLETA